MRSLTIAISIALLATACGGGAATPGDDGELVITMTEFAFSPDNIEVSPGQSVTFVLVNEGEKEHEFMAGNDVMVVDGIPNGFEHDFFEDVNATVEPMDALEMDMGGDEEMGDEEMGEDEMGEAGHAGFMVARLPNEEARITFTVPVDASGEYQFGCFEEDGAHWDDGMKGTLTVTDGA